MQQAVTADARPSKPGSSLGDSIRRLPRERLLVQAPFARDDKIRAGKVLLKIENLKHELRAGPQRCVRERKKSRANSTGSARTGNFSHINANFRLCDVGKL